MASITPGEIYQMITGVGDAFEGGFKEARQRGLDDEADAAASRLFGRQGGAPKVPSRGINFADLGSDEGPKFNTLGRTPAFMAGEGGSPNLDATGIDLKRFAVGGATRPDGLTGFKPEFTDALGRMIAAAPPEIQESLRISSGYRSPERQAQLWDEALQKYGSPEAARKWVAPPGRSNHNHGQAADLKYLSPAAREWAHKNAGQFGLSFPLGNEDWHIELASARGGNANPADAHAPGAQNAQFTFPGQTGAGAVSTGMTPELYRDLRIMMRSDKYRPMAVQLLQQMTKQRDVKTVDLGNAIGVMDDQGNIVRQIPKQGAEKWSRLNDGTLYNATTGETRAVEGQQGGPFRGNAVDAQALNYLVQQGRLTAEQAAEIAAGKQITDPSTGQILFMTPSAIMQGQGGGPSAQQQAQTQAPTASQPAPSAPQQRPGVLELTPPKAEKPTEKMRSDLALAERTAATLKEELKNLMGQVAQSGAEVLPTEAKARMQTTFTNIQMQLKNLYELGAITGPDMEILGSLLTNPTVTPYDPREWGKGFNMEGRTRVQVEELGKIIDRSLESARKALGGQSTQPQGDAAQGLQAGTYEYVPGQGLVRR